MRIITIFLFGIFLHVSASSYSQTVTLAGKDLPPAKIFSAIKAQTGYAVFGNASLLRKMTPVSLNVGNMPLDEFLKMVFKDQPVAYELGIKSRNIIIYSAATSPTNLYIAPARTIRILVTDSVGKPLPGATVTNKRTKLSKTTTNEGTVMMDVADGDVIEISFVSFQTQTIKVSSNTTELTIPLKIAEKNLDEMVVNTGILTRKKESFTGAVASFTGKELRQIGNGNVLQSLKTLDPSFIITPNNNLGSNPNQLLSIQLRGTTSVTSSTEIKNQFAQDPNQPLFVLNGMESSLQQIVDLDINRIASITILKDAASTALYGSKAANGVVVVETIRPRPGDLRISYTNDFRSQIPDLRDYNMMNATEFLQFQKLSGYYDPSERQNSQLILDTLYNNRLKNVLSGVNTYWLNVPLRNAYTVGHTLRANGGSNEFQYDAMVSYKTAPGVMKSSGRNTWAGSVDLSYRRNKVNILNQVYASGSLGTESPYGNFSDYVQMAPYYRKYDKYGRLNTSKYLESFEGGSSTSFLDEFNTPNPLYNASLNPKNETSSFSVQDNLALIWDISSDWRFTSGVLVSKSSGSTTVFTPAANTLFDLVDVSQKGSYSYTQLNSSAYSGNIMFTYQKVFNDKHSLTGNIRGEIDENRQQSIGLTAVGFPDGVDPNPAFAAGYALNSKPSYAEIKTRQASVLGSINYVFANKYYADATFRMDGSTVFGSAKKYSPFWAVGIGWTVNKEDFLKNAGWLSLLRLRGNIGTNGNQQLGSFVSSSVYGYQNTTTGFGTGLYLNQLGVPTLKWQNTQQISTGIDLAINNNRGIATLNAYQKLTDPLIIGASAAASVGVPTYALNAGRLNVKGLEVILRYSPIYKLSKGIQWTLGLTGSIEKSRYGGFSSLLAKENEANQNNFNSETSLGDVTNYLTRFLDGHSPDEIWAVRSLGIDPATGNEILVKKDGSHTFLYDPQDEVVVGNSMPKVQGVISSNLSIKSFFVGINLRYSLGQSALNTALFTKVENIGFSQLIYNQDRRALYDRWKQPGDIAMFKNINLADPNVTSTYSPPSSRFIQKENFLSGESISAGYEFLATAHRWLQPAKIRSIRLTGYMNDVFRLSNIKAERGIDYPFANMFSLSLSLFF